MTTKGQIMDNSKLVNQKGFFYIICYIMANNAAVVNS